MLLDDRDEFGNTDRAYLAYRCPSCGGFREDGCSICAQYAHAVATVELEIREDVLSGKAQPTAEWPNIADIHVEVIRRYPALSK